jgi:hypothetical protein
MVDGRLPAPVLSEGSMTDRQQQYFPSDEQTTRLPPAAPAPVSAPPPPPLPATPVPVTDLRETTLPLVPAPAAPAEDASILGFPAEVGGDDAEEEAEEEAEEAPPPQAPAGVPAGAGGLVVLRRPDRLGGILLLLAGVAAGASLWFPWVRRTGATGLTLARRAIDAAGTGVGALGRSGLWQPLAVVLGGAVLFLLGLLLFRRARTHRLVGLLALLVAEAVTVGVVVLLAGARWLPGRIGPGLWLAVAAAGLGLLGALKALLSGPRVTTEV